MNDGYYLKLGDFQGHPVWAFLESRVAPWALLIRDVRHSCFLTTQTATGIPNTTHRIPITDLIFDRDEPVEDAIRRRFGVDTTSHALYDVWTFKYDHP